MMQHLSFDKANCKNCYKCLRECPVKSIAIIDHQASIQDENCILCGNCVYVCHQNAKHVSSEKEVVERLLKSKKVVASLAPSFVSSFKVPFAEMKRALLCLGFFDVEETAVAAKVVTERYEDYLEREKPQNFITSCCPSVNRLVCQYYPSAMKYLAPFDSPMVAHGKILKEEHEDILVVFIGPCISKKREAEESKVIDGVLTFEDILEMFVENNITLATEETPVAPTDQRPASRAYPVSRGIIKSLKVREDQYEYVAVDGVDRCMEVLANIDNVENMFIEMSACQYSCVNGPCSLVSGGENVKSLEKVRKYAGNKHVEDSGLDIEIETVHNGIPIVKKIPSEQKIKEILRDLGKESPEDYLDCGVCGYPSCKEKAISLYNGLSEPQMCLPFMRERADAIHFDIIDTSPNGIIAVNENLVISRMNNSAKAILGVTGSVAGTVLFDYMNVSDFMLCISSGESMNWKTVTMEKTGRVVEMTIRNLKDQKTLYTIMRDITERAEYEEILSAVKQDTLLACDDVIQKQMRVVQEIASLLGETAAETKVALLKLKETIETK